MSIQPALLVNLALLVSCYLIGSFSFAIICARLCNIQDPRTIGSYNPGATNMQRYAGKPIAAIVLILDASKGVLAVSFFDTESWQLLGLFVAIIGHIFPLYYNFRGGKGVATALGGMLAFSLLIGAYLLLVWLTTYLVVKKSFVGALATFTVLPFILIWEKGLATQPLLFSIGLLALLIFTHRSNIRSAMR